MVTSSKKTRGSPGGIGILATTLNCNKKKSHTQLVSKQRREGSIIILGSCIFDFFLLGLLLYKWWKSIISQPNKLFLILLTSSSLSRVWSAYLWTIWEDMGPNPKESDKQEDPFRLYLKLHTDPFAVTDPDMNAV